MRSSCICHTFVKLSSEHDMILVRAIARSQIKRNAIARYVKPMQTDTFSQT